MNAAVIFGESGPVCILTSHSSIENPALVEQLERKGLRKFIAYPIPIELVREKYGEHFEITCGDWHESDDLRVLDFDGHRIMTLFDLNDFGTPVRHQPAYQAAGV